MATNPNITEAELQNIDAMLADLDDDIEAKADAGPVADITEQEIVEAIKEDEDEAIGDVELGAAGDTVEEPETETAVETAPAEDPAGLNELDLDPSDLAALDLEDARQEAYETQETTGSVEEPEKVEEAAPASVETTPAPKPARKTKTAAAPRTPRDLSSVGAEHFVLTDEAPTDLEANKATVLAALPTQKKVAEKYENAITALSVGKAPSTYTMDAFAILDAKKEVTSADIVAGLRAAKKRDGSTYGEGTARSQAGQMMALFPALGIAKRVDAKLVLQPNSRLAGLIRGHLAA